ncbi:MSMEG_0567/sll0787 family protein [Kutzneria sp. NPDC052558]|uniref:MSMEG_0567/sll0787 family protein n=1 Tax=Kutzneria sp. NPDC052558 TaxID=3364121 RepID=UPI0037C95226
MTAIGEVLLGTTLRCRIRVAEASDVDAYRRLRADVFVAEQGLFHGSDLDWRDEDPRTVVLVAHDPAGEVIGGVRLGPATPGEDVGWWVGGRLVVRAGDRRLLGVGAALVNAAAAHAEGAGVLRFEATVQTANVVLFRRLGWLAVRDTVVAGQPHVLMRWPINRIAALASATKRELGPLLKDLLPKGFLGDDGVPVPGSDLVACCDAITPSMVERDPEWAGWCSVLVNANDLSAMGASPLGLLDALGARDRALASRVLDGLRAAAEVYGLPVLGGHTQFGVPASLAVTALGHAPNPVPGGGGRPGMPIRLTADLGGGWRPGYAGRQWDSSTHRTSAELRTMLDAVRRAHPSAAKDVSMAGVAGTLGMMAEAGGCGAVLDVAAVPRPVGASMGDWLTCFPGFAMLTAGEQHLDAGPAVQAGCGELTTEPGIRLRWPDGEVTEAIAGPVTGLGAA